MRSAKARSGRRQAASGKEKAPRGGMTANIAVSTCDPANGRSAATPPALCRLPLACDLLNAKIPRCGVLLPIVVGGDGNAAGGAALAGDRIPAPGAEAGRVNLDVAQEAAVEGGRVLAV